MGSAFCSALPWPELRVAGFGLWSVELVLAVRERSGMGAAPFGALRPLPLTLNSQLRTDADKGNPTV